MDTSMSEESNQKKDPFENLSKEELIKKCRQFLTIAQKAKQAKDDLNEENRIIRKNLEDLENNSHNEFTAMGETINVLTSQKLDLVTNIDTLKKQKQDLNSEYKTCQQELVEVSTKVQTLDTENQGYSRQIKRLSEENDQLISHLDSLEKRINELNEIGEQQREQLLSLEKQNTNKGEMQENSATKNSNLDSSTFHNDGDNTNVKDLEQLQVKCDKFESELQNAKLILVEKDKKIEHLCEEIDTLKIKNEQVTQLKNYCQLKTNEIVSLQEKIDDLNNIINNFNITLSKNENIIEKCKKDVTDLQKELSDVNNSLIHSEEKYNLLSEELVNTKKTKEHYNEKFKCYHTKLIKVFTDLKELKQTKNNLLLVIQSYSKYINKWQNDIKQVSERFKGEIKNRDLEIDFHKKENAELKANIIELTDKLANIQSNDEIEKLEMSKKLLEEKLNSLLKENTKVLEANNEIEKRLKQHNETTDISNKEIETHKQKMVALLKENEQLNFTISAAEETFKMFEEKITHSEQIEESQKKLLEEIHNNEERINSLVNENKLLVEDITNNNEKMNEISQNFDDLKRENQSLLLTIQNEKDNYNILEKTKNELQENINGDSKKFESQNLEHLKTINDLQDQIKNNFIAKDLYEIMSKANDDLTEKNQHFKETSQKYEDEISSYKRDLTDLQNKLSISKRENVELLREMNDMNQALKERGETISKQQEHSQELLRQVQNLEQESANCGQQKNKLEDEVASLKSQTTNQDLSEILKERDILLNEKTEIIGTLEQELKQLKESFNNNIGRENQDASYGDNETMSTSTISRIDDAARLRDLEGSWEERYTKLRTLALKLKGKVKELNEQLSQERSEKSDMQNKLTTVTRNLQTVQSEYDKIQDHFESTDKETKKKIKQIEQLTTENEKIKQELVVNKENCSKLQLQLDTLRKEKVGSNSAVKQFTSQIQNLKKEIDDNIEKNKNFENKIAKLLTNVSTKEEELQNEIKSHNSTKEKLQKNEKDIKKSSVLTLEMDDYERSLKDLSQKLEKKNELITKLEENITSQNNIIASLKDQLQALEEKNVNEETNSQNLEKRLVEAQTKISIAEATTAQKENRIREVIKSLEDYKISTEEQNSELSQTVVQNQKQNEQLKLEKEHCKSIVLGLETKIKELTKIANDREEELTHLRDEFSHYKVRAQSVLRQNQTRDVGVEERLNEEVNEFKSEVELLTTQVENVSKQLKIMSDKYETASNEKIQVVLKCEELENMLINEKDNKNILLEKQHQLISEHRESMRAQKIHTDTLSQCYKQQLAEQEERHIKELTELRAAHAHSQAQTKSQEETVDFTFMQREEGEGSESVESSSNNNQLSKTSILSLDKLLNADIDNNITLDAEAELQRCKKQIAEYETKLTHLTDLLADTEQDLAKHTQLNDHLKEEIRRHQRSVEREKHAENLEYLKNVVFKFLTLSNGDERSHLVPVLNTILKLSPEETQKLNAVVKGTDASVRNWGSYLPIWSGSNNQH